MFATNLSRSKIQCCKSAEFYTYNWSILCNWRWRLLSYNLVFRRTFTSTSGRHFLLNFPCSEVLSVWSSVSFQIARRKVVFFVRVLPTLLAFCCGLFWRDKRSVPKTMIALEVFVQEKNMILISESLILVYFEFRLSSQSAMFFFIICRVSGLRESQSLALNSNLLRDKLKLQW